MTDPIRLEDHVEFAENPEPRCPCILLLDTSGSMKGEPLAALGEGLERFRDELRRDALAARRVEVAVVAFDSEIRVASDFVTADAFEPPELEAQGLTRMGEAVHRALDLLEERKAEYRAAGVDYYRPWVFLLTDGAPQGEPEESFESAAARIRVAEEQRQCAFFSVGVEGADLARLSQLSVRTPLKLAGLAFVELFVWLSRSMEAVAHSREGEQVPLPPPGWTEV